jgi:hypothetical protein
MTKIKRDSVIEAPLVSGVVGVFVFFLLYFVVNLREMNGDLIGINMGFFISLMMAVVVAAILFGELLAEALEGK